MWRQYDSEGADHAAVDANQAKQNGVTPLYMAAQDGHEAVVRALIELGADVNKATDRGRRPLSISIAPPRNVAQEGHAAIVQILRDAGAV